MEHGQLVTEGDGTGRDHKTKLVGFWCDVCGKVIEQADALAKRHPHFETDPSKEQTPR